MATSDVKRKAKRKWAEANPHYALEWARRKRLDPAYRAKESLRQLEWQKKRPVETAIRQYKCSARHKGLSLDLTDMEVAKLLMAPCHYCGINPDPINGIDRVDNAIGYLASNVVTACGMCNYAKRNNSTKQFEDWALRLAAHLTSRRIVGDT